MKMLLVINAQKYKENIALKLEIKMEFLCESCRFCEEKIEEIIKPLYAFSSEVHKVKRLTIFCNFSFRYKRMLVKKCEDYKPKSGKIGKKLYQKQIGE